MGLPQIEIASAKIENENAYINEMYLINVFDKRLRSGVPRVSVRTRQPGRVRLGGHFNFNHSFLTSLLRSP